MITEKDTEVDVTNQNLLYLLDKESQYYTSIISLTSKELITACFTQGFNSIPYIPLSTSNCIEINGYYTRELLNPYTKYQSLTGEKDEYYYIAVHFSKAIENNLRTKVSYTIKTASHQIDEEQKVVIKLKEPYMINKIQEEEESSQIVVFNINNCEKSKYQYVLILNDIPFNTVSFTQLNNFIRMENYKSDMEIIFNEGDVVFSYNYALKSDSDAFSFNSNFDIEVTSSGKSINVLFNYFINELTRYEIYATQVNSLDDRVNACVLSNTKSILTFDEEKLGDDKSMTLNRTIDVSSTGYYAINVIAYQISGIKARAVYKSSIVIIPSFIWLYIVLGIVIVLITFGILGYYLNKRRKLHLEDPGSLLNRNLT